MDFIPQAVPSFDEHEADALRDYVLSGGWGTEFKKTEELESLLSDFTGAGHCIITTSGTVGLSLALMAAGVEPGDEVIVPDMTMVATPNSARMFGAVPVFVDVEPKTLNIDVAQVEHALTPRTRAVVHVSLNGRSNDLDALISLCRRNGVRLVEDAAQSLGSYHGGKHLGTLGDLGCLSFSTPKVITTGQGGAVLTNDADIAQSVRKIKDFGRRGGGNDIHESIGFNFKFTDFQAVIGIEQMKKLPGRLQRKKDMWNRYREHLANIGEIAWIETDTKHVAPWFMDIYVEDKAALEVHLKDAGVGSRAVYPPIHSQEAYGLNDLSFPVTEDFSRRGLWLPSSAALTEDQVDYVCDAIQAFYKG
jgi:perosamine synthetase